MDLVSGLTKTEADKIEAGLTLGIGLLTWEVAATTPFDIGVSPFTAQRFADAISQTFGPGVAKQLFPMVSLKSAGQAITPWGALNKYTGSGVALLVLDWALDTFVGTEYRKMDGLGAFVRGTGKGLVGGGIVGGFFNPPVAGVRPAGTYTPASGFAGQNLPYAGGPVLASAAIGALNR
jgi:hypothetical protein